ncbi:sterile alpha motif domain-containing protein 7 [Sigmodon hispidus]
MECWGQKYRLRRGSVYQKPLENITESFKSQAEEKKVPYEEEEDIIDPEVEVDNLEKSRGTDQKPTSGLTNPCGELPPSQTKPSSQGAKAQEGGKEKLSEQGCEDWDKKDGVGLPVPILPLPGTHELVAFRENCSSADIQRWTVDDVHNFIKSLPGCSDYAQVFKDHAIDGETLPLLTEQHLRDTMGLKLGPALKIQSQVSQHVGNMFCKKIPSLLTHARQAFNHPANTSPLLDDGKAGNPRTWSRVAKLETNKVRCLCKEFSKVKLRFSYFIKSSGKNQPPQKLEVSSLPGLYCIANKPCCCIPDIPVSGGLPGARALRITVGPEEEEKNETVQSMFLPARLGPGSFGTWRGGSLEPGSRHGFYPPKK